MNESTIDNLFAVPPVVPDAGSVPGARQRDDSNEFGNRLRQASAPPAEPWWRAAPNRSESNPRSSAGSAPLLSLPRPSNRAPKPTKDDSPPPRSDSARSNSTEQSDRPASRNDNAPARDSDKSSTDSSATTAAATASAQPAPANDESQAAKIESAAAQKTDATTAASLPSTEQDSPLTIGGKSTTTTKDAASSQQQLPATTQQSTVSPTDSTAEVAVAKQDASVADVGPKSVPVEAAAKPIEQAAPPTLATAGETPTANANSAEPSVETTSAKKADAKAATNQKPTAKLDDQVGLSSVKRLAAVQANADGAQPAVTAVVASATSDQKSTAQQDPAPANDKGAGSGEPQPTAPIQTNGNQPAPVVAAVTTAVAADQAAANNGNADSGQKVTKISGPPNNSTLAAFGRIDRGAGSLTANGPRQAGDGPDMPTIDPTRFISRVAKAIETAQDRGGPLNLRLSPPELGSMRIQLDVKQGVMTAKVETDTAVARQALLDNLPTLRDRLAEHNVRIDRFDVDVRRDGTGDQASPGKQHQQQYTQTSVPRTLSKGQRAGESAPAEPAPLDRIITNTTINLVA